MAKPPESTKISLQQKLAAHAAAHFPAIERLEVRFRAQFAYVAAVLREEPGTAGYGVPVPLMRLRYGGSAGSWGFAFYRAGHEDYEDSYLPDGSLVGSPQAALDCAAGVYAGPRTLDHETPTPTN